MDKYYRYKLILYKNGQMKYFSQLDLLRILERALRRANFPLVFKKGFNPRIKISFGPAIKLGEPGRQEAILYFREKVRIDQVKKDLTLQLPEGLLIEKIEEINGQ